MSRTSTTRFLIKTRFFFFPHTAKHVGFSKSKHFVSDAGFITQLGSYMFMLLVNYLLYDQIVRIFCRIKM